MDDMETSDVMKRMKAQGRRYRRYNRRRNEELAKFQELIRQADTERGPDGQRVNRRVDIIHAAHEAAGVARATVYAAWREPDPGEENTDTVQVAVP